MTSDFGRTGRNMGWERFEALAAAYGADLRRWPQAERGRAQALSRSNPGRAQAILAAEGELDALLAQSVVPAPSRRLQLRILASARSDRNQPVAALRWLVRAPMLTGAAAAAVCAGLLCGVMMSQGVVSEARQDILSNMAPSEPAGADAASERTI